MAGSDRVEESDFARGGWTSGPGMRGERSLGSRWGETRPGVSLGAATPAAAGAGDAHLHGSTAGGLLAPGCEENEAWGPDGAKQDPGCLWEPPPPQRLVLAMLTSTAPPASPSKTSAPGTPRWGSARTRSPSTIDLNGTCMALVPRHESRFPNGEDEVPFPLPFSLSFAFFCPSSRIASRSPNILPVRGYNFQ
ncbi:hypothetical protein PVAP13_3KG400601 [Panicum virgatum]|uniref:Uncharacterized protein n=1 Tax=Panicum virgatum TaxID=38727 RepID=A0A8T0V4D0_PANVG|nr:hypothetical protein PVAP13_3KG400601 [Panicum virgatum]